MVEELITFETAKLAKEKGFEQKNISNHYLDNAELDTSGMSWINGLSLGSAPTQSLLQRWLREVHNIHIYIEPYNNNNSIDYVPYVLKPVFNTMSGCTLELGKTILSYEEALEIGIYKALKLI